MKKIFMFAILFGAAMTFAACGSKENKECEAEEAPEVETVAVEEEAEEAEEAELTIPEALEQLGEAIETEVAE